uniref:Olfactory receptor n=1 Tax=Prolemur simus TaxID=1328070 RepID=A0A8C8YHW1_PROSS
MEIVTCYFNTSIMMLFNTSSFQPLLLSGFSGLENYHPQISIFFCVLYLISIMGNSTILVAIWVEQSLHEPMYLFLSLLAVSDLGLCATTLLTVLKIFWFNTREIHFDACLAQMYFIHIFSMMESGILLSMAFDRYVAISDPLRYTAILNSATVVKISIGFVLRAVIVLIPAPVFIKQLKFCEANVLSHSYCLHPDIIKLSCSDHCINSFLGLIVIIITFGLDSVVILLSYVKILMTVLGIASQKERLKALNTCASHICAVLILYVPMIGLSLVHRYAKHSSPICHITMANIYLLVPPVLNPIIYSIKTKQIRQGFLKILLPKRVGLTHP